MIRFSWYGFDELSNRDLYQLLQARQEVFVVEQQCVYQDIDNADFHAFHLVARFDTNTGLPGLAGYLRVIPPSDDSVTSLPSIGRVLTTKDARGRGVGKSLLREALNKTQTHYPNRPVLISAQAHLEKFYGEFGFVKCSEPYDEDGIAHIKMQT